MGTGLLLTSSGFETNTTPAINNTPPIIRFIKLVFIASSSLHVFVDSFPGRFGHAHSGWHREFLLHCAPCESTATHWQYTLKFHAKYPERIVCLTEETTETLYLLGEQNRIVGISGFTVRPPQARKEKPRVSAFTSAKIDKILDLKPDLVIGFSDLQADIARDLIKHGVNVLLLNHRSVNEILSMILQLAALTGVPDKGEHLIASYISKIESCIDRARQLKQRPTVYFEEWDDPMISAIRWVSELVGIAGGDDCFPELAACAGGAQRIIANPQTIIAANPDIIIGSWCGKKFRPEKVAARDGWDQINAVKNNELHEIKSPIILQPGPAALLDGLSELEQIIHNAQVST